MPLLEEVTQKVNTFIGLVNSGLVSMRKEALSRANVSLLESKSEKNKRFPVIEILLSNNKISYARSSKQHAKLIVEQKAWTFTSAHLNDSARHVLLYVNGKMIWEVDNSLTWAPYDFTKVITLWVNSMSKAGLVNYSGKIEWPDKDQLHLESPSSRPPRNSPKVKASIKEYVRITRREGKQLNGTVENKFKEEIKGWENYWTTIPK